MSEICSIFMLRRKIYNYFSKFTDSTFYDVKTNVKAKLIIGINLYRLYFTQFENVSFRIKKISNTNTRKFFS